MKKVLLTNDDGIHSLGLRLLAERLQEHFEVYTIAPDSDRSGAGHSVNLNRPIKMHKENINGIINPVYGIDGTPADCVRVGMEILYKDIDLVISGINRGFNAGGDVIYSGTVGAAEEGANYNIPSIAISTEYIGGSSDFVMAVDVAIEMVLKYVDKVMERPNMVFNINIPKIPKEDIKGVKICPLDGPMYDSFRREEITDTISFIYLTGRQKRVFEVGSDRYYLNKGYITITPMELEFTNESLIEKFKGL